MTYSNTLALGRRQYGSNRRHQNLVSFKREGKRVGPITNTIILIVLACLLGLLYLTQVTKTNIVRLRNKLTTTAADPVPESK